MLEQYADTLKLFEFGGYTYKEIAEIEGIPIGTVMSRIYRARTILAEDENKELYDLLKA